MTPKSSLNIAMYSADNVSYLYVVVHDLMNFFFHGSSESIWVSAGLPPSVISGSLPKGNKFVQNGITFHADSIMRNLWAPKYHLPLRLSLDSDSRTRALLDLAMSKSTRRRGWRWKRAVFYQASTQHISLLVL